MEAANPARIWIDARVLFLLDMHSYGRIGTDWFILVFFFRIIIGVHGHIKRNY